MRIGQKPPAPPVPSGTSGLKTAAVGINHAFLTRLRGEAFASSRPKQVSRIMIVDDAPLIISMFTRLLPRHLKTLGLEAEIIPVSELANTTRPDDKITILTANTQDDILAASQEIIAHEVGLVFTDFNMGNIDGAQLTKQARDSGYNGFVIGMTGEIAANMLPFLEAGADVVLAKPFTPADIKGIFTN